MDNIQEILKACLKGDRMAQKSLYQLYADKMFGVCIRYTNNEEEAKDILQEGFIKVFTNLKQFHNKGSFEGWVRRIMINTALEKFRDKSHLYAVNSDIEREYENLNYDHILDEIAAKDLLVMINKLSPQYRIVFNLYAIEGYSHKEISKMLKIKEGTSKSNLSRAREILKDKILDYFRVSKVNISG